MARLKTANACATSKTPDQLTGVYTRLTQNDPEYTFEEAQGDIDRIFAEWSLNKTAASFEELLVNAQLDGYGFEYNSNIDKKDKQIRIKRLDKENTTLFRYRDTALNKINGMFSRQTFKHLFVNRSKSYSGTRYIVSPSDFNNGVIAFKNTLAATIIDGLNIDWKYNQLLFSKTGAVTNNGLYLIDILFNSREISGKDGILQRLDLILDDPITHDKELRIVLAIYALNNFDSMLESELQGLIKIQPGNKGLLNNTFYTLETTGKSTEYWASDTHEDKSLSKYTSNLARFIVRQIPKVIKTASGNFRHIEGKYLNANDLYVLSSAIKLAEFEYLLMNPDDPVVLAIDLIEGIRKLMANRHDLPALKNAKTELLDSLSAFLWEGTDADLSIETIYQQEIKKNPKALDVESLLGFEIYQSSAPSYLEYDTSGLLTTKNYGGLYQSGNALKWGITEFIYTSLQSKVRLFTKTMVAELKSGNISQDTKEAIVNTIAYDILGFDTDYSETVKEFTERNIEDILNLAKLLTVAISNPNTEIRNAISEGAASAYKAIENYVALVLLSKGATFNGKSCTVSPKFTEEYDLVISDSAITLFKSNSGSEIPVYRLNSSFTHLSWFLHQYRTTQIGKGLNFLVDYPHLLYKYNSSGKFNKHYKGYANYVLGYGHGDDTVNFNEMTTADLMHIMMLTNLLSRKDGVFYFLPACYSDKISIGLVALNLQEIIKLAGSGVNIKAEDLLDPLDVLESITRIRELDFLYRRNSLSNTINSIIDKWYRYLMSNEYTASEEEKAWIEKYLKPIDNKALAAMFAVSGKDYLAHAILLEKVQYLLKKLSEFDKTKLKLAVLWGSKADVDFIDQLDYVIDKKTKSLEFNLSLLLDFLDLSDFDSFNARLDEVLLETLSSEEYSDMLASIKEKLSNSTPDDPYFKLLIGAQKNKRELQKTGETKLPPKYFVRSWNTKKGEKGGYEVRVVLEADGTVPFDEMFKLHAALSNLGRFAFLDLVSKSYYLDPPKGKYSNGHEEAARRIDSMAKRMVLYPATIQAYLQGRIDGVSQTIRVSAIEDPSEEVWNPQGDSNGQDIFDGSGIIAPWHSMMEDNSLPGHGIKGTKKTLGTSTIGQNSTLFKWAGFPITNEKMRNSLTGKYNLHRLFYKMNNVSFDDDTDITKGYLGNSLSIPSMLVNKQLYVSDGLNYYNIANIVKVPGVPNTYTITKIACNSNGVKLRDTASGDYIVVTEPNVKIDTIYKLWDVLGGLNSMELENGQLEPSEASIEATFLYIVNVGTVEDPKATHYNQSNVRQPLRNKYISIAASKSALKRGAANINTAEDAWESDEELASFKVNTSSFGVQLDANHHADLSDVREMSQTISTLASGGHTSFIAQQAYKSIGDLVQLSLKKVSSYLKLAELKGLEKSIEAISERLVKRLASETKINSTDFIEAFVSELEVNKVLPISDRRFYKMFVKEIIEDLNKSSIKRRYSGLGGILNPASNILQIYTIGDNTYTFTTLLKIAKRELSKNPKIKRALLKFFSEKKNLIINDLIQQDQVDFSFYNGKNHDIDIVNFYLAYTEYGDVLSPEQIIDKFLNGNEPITRGIKNVHSIWDKVTILDTVRYKKPDDTIWTQVTLDSRETLNNFMKTLENSIDPKTGMHTLLVELVLSVPHDLRPLIATWTSKLDIKGQQVDVTETSFTSIFSRFAATVKDNPFESDSVTTDLAKQGKEIMENCK